jgi:chromosome segregation ATPase
MQTLYKILLGVLAVALALMFVKMRSATSAFAGLSAQNLALSNQLAGAEAKLAESVNAVSTLKVKNQLLQDDHLQASNQLASARAQLERLRATSQETEFKLTQCEALVGRLRSDAAARSQQHERDLAALADARAELERLRPQLANLAVESRELTRKLNLSETARGRLLQDLNDDSFLRARIRVLSAPSPKPDDLASLRKHGRLVLRPDGTVEVMTSEPTSPAESEP